MKWLFASCCFILLSNHHTVLCEQHSSSPPRIITRVQVTLNGDIYYVDDVTTVEMLQNRLWEESGYTEDEQGYVTYQGQVLSQPNIALSDVGVQDGDQINMVPNSMAKHWTVINEMRNGLQQLEENILLQNNNNKEKQRKDKTSNNQKQKTNKHYTEQLKVLTTLYNDMTNKIPFMQDEMDEFSLRMRHPISLQYANDPDRIEKLRQIIVNNPMLLSYIMMGGASSRKNNRSSLNHRKTTSSIGYIIQDKKKWRQLVQNNVGYWKHLNGYQLWRLLVKDNIYNLNGGEEEEEIVDDSEGSSSSRYSDDGDHHQDGDYEEEEVDDDGEYYEEEEEED